MSLASLRHGGCMASFITGITFCLRYWLAACQQSWAEFSLTGMQVVVSKKLFNGNFISSRWQYNLWFTNSILPSIPIKLDLSHNSGVFEYFCNKLQMYWRIDWDGSPNVAGCNRWLMSASMPAAYEEQIEFHSSLCGLIGPIIVRYLPPPLPHTSSNTKNGCLHNNSV